MNIINYNTISLESIKIGDLIYDDKKDIYYSNLINNTVLLNNLIKVPNFKLNNVFEINNILHLELEFLPNGYEFYDFLYKLDLRIIEEFAKNSVELVGTELNYDTIETLYHKSIIIPDHIPALPIVNFSISDNCVILDKNSNQISINELKESNELCLLIRLDKLEFHKNKYKLIIVVEFIQISNYFCDYCMFLDNDPYINSNISTDTE